MPPLVWRLPPWQPAVLFLVTAALAAANLYASPSTTVRVITVALAVAAFVAGVAAARMYLVADDEGVGVRRFGAEAAVAWSEIVGVDVIRQRGGVMTLQLRRQDAAPVPVPSSLVLPTRPTSLDRTRRLLETRAHQLRARRPPGQ